MAGIKLDTITTQLRRGIVQGFFMVILGVIMGFLCNSIRPDGLAWIGNWTPSAVAARAAEELDRITLSEAYSLSLENKAIFLDARDMYAFESGHIPGAIQVNLKDIQAQLSRIRDLKQSGKVLISYCEGLDCNLSIELALALKSYGIDKVKVFPDGWAAWYDSGYPIEEGKSK